MVDSDKFQNFCLQSVPESNAGVLLWAMQIVTRGTKLINKLIASLMPEATDATAIRIEFVCTTARLALAKAANSPALSAEEVQEVREQADTLFDIEYHRQALAIIKHASLMARREQELAADISHLESD